MILITQKASVSSGTLFSIRARRQLQGSPKICPSEHRGRADAIQGIRLAGSRRLNPLRLIADGRSIGNSQPEIWRNTGGWTDIRRPVRMFFNSCRAGSDPRRLLPAIAKSSAHLLRSEEPEILAAYRRHVILSAAESRFRAGISGHDQYEP